MASISPAGLLDGCRPRAAAWCGALLHLQDVRHAALAGRACAPPALLPAPCRSAPALQRPSFMVVTGSTSPAPSPHHLPPLPPACRLLETLREAFNPEGAGRNLFFSYGADLTLHAQRQADVLADPVQAAKPLHARADRRFFWNRFVAKPLVDAGADK